MTTNETKPLGEGEVLAGAAPEVLLDQMAKAPTPAVPNSAVAAQRHDPEAISKAVQANLSPEDRATHDRFNKVTAAARAHREQLREEGEGKRSRPSDLGGMRLKLSVAGRIPGYHLYWENDSAGAIETLLFEGFEFATPEECKMSSAFVSDAELGFRISRFVGSDEEGKPMRAYLLKCPDEIWAEREQARYEQADTWDSDIRNGALKGDGRYKPKGIDIDVNTQYRKDYGNG